MIQAHRSNDGNVRIDHVGGIPPAAKADFYNGDVHGGVGKRGIGQADEDLELGHGNVRLGIDHLHKRLDLVPDAHIIARMDGLAIDADALGNALQVRAGDQADAAVEGPQERIHHARGRGLAVGPGNVDDIEGTFRVAE